MGELLLPEVLLDEGIDYLLIDNKYINLYKRGNRFVPQPTRACAVGPPRSLRTITFFAWLGLSC